MFGNATYKGRYRKISNKSNSASKTGSVFDKQWLVRVSVGFDCKNSVESHSSLFSFYIFEYLIVGLCLNIIKL